jgi:hypothetical protein
MRVRAVRIKFQGSLELILGFVPIPVIPEDGLRPFESAGDLWRPAGKKIPSWRPAGKKFWRPAELTGAVRFHPLYMSDVQQVISAGKSL